MARMCGCCETQPAEIVATVPMCGERPRYPMCMDCAAPLVECGYAEDIDVLTPSHPYTVSREETE